MTREFVELPMFRKKWKSLGLTDKDLMRLKKNLLPTQKPVLLCKIPVVFAKCDLHLSIVEKAEV